MPSYKIVGSYELVKGDSKRVRNYKLYYRVLDYLIQTIDKNARFICVTPFEIIFTTTKIIESNYTEKYEEIDILGNKYNNLQFIINQV